jgi:sec-independent protein translocase protein TatA
VDVGPAELLIVLMIALLLFGSSRLPKLARSMGEAAKEFRAGINQSAQDESSDAREK